MEPAEQPHSFLDHTIEQWQRADPIHRGQAAADGAIDFFSQCSDDLGMLCK